MSPDQTRAAAKALWNDRLVNGAFWNGKEKKEFEKKVRKLAKQISLKEANGNELISGAVLYLDCLATRMDIDDLLYKDQ